MKAKVVKKFKDKETKNKVLRKPGEIITVNKKRFDELVAAGNYVEAVEENKEPDEAESDNK